jgi:CoA:oxalate CoA-transferase
MADDKKGPLDGVVVLDLTIAIAGPYATTVLAALGATVITIEHGAKTGGRESGPFLGREGVTLERRHEDDVGLVAVRRFRNKNCVSLDMKKPRARRVFADLVRKADILVQNFSVGAAARMGAGYDEVHALNPRLIYCSISGFGQDETSGSGKAIDTVIQGLSGIMMVGGSEGEEPARVGVPIADLTTPLYAVVGVLSALQQRERTGLGQHVDVTMMGSVLNMIAIDDFEENQALGISNRSGPRSEQYAPLGMYQAADDYVIICAGGDLRCFTLFDVMGRTELQSDPRYCNRVVRARNAAAVDAEVTAWTRTLPADEIVELLDAVGIPSSRVRGVSEALRDPRAHERGEVVRLAHPKYGAPQEVFGPGLPIRFSDAKAGLGTWASGYGEDNDKIYRDFLGYSAEEVAALREDAAI